MGTFEKMAEAWRVQCGTPPGSVSKLENEVSPLLNSEDIERVRQGIKRLKECGDASLVLILQEANGSLDVSRNFSENRSAVERCVLEAVTRADSAWHPLFQEGCFDRMMLRSVEDADWGSLSVDVQARVIAESKRLNGIELGTFRMGAPRKLGTNARYWLMDLDQQPTHRVTLTRAFSMGMYPVTQALWEHVMGNNPSQFTGSSRPVERVCWAECVVFCNKLSTIDGLEPVYSLDGMAGSDFSKVNRYLSHLQCNFDADGYRLPTEAEWEYSARCNQRFKLSGSDDADEVAWHGHKHLPVEKKTRGVGLKMSNAFGLYDMSGNVAEWCWDVKRAYNRGLELSETRSSDLKAALLREGREVPRSKNDRYQALIAVIDPTGAPWEKYAHRVYRGGSWDESDFECNVFKRWTFNPDHRSSMRGFRLARTIRG